MYLKHTAYANAQATTLRVRLLEIGGVVIRNTRRVNSERWPSGDAHEIFGPQGQDRSWCIHSSLLEF
ncbi:MAG: hypothetical protein J5F18_01840 [Halomonas sp. BM-2019]|nr:MAG: hypothetical protein J5F18_01840 [Halomonas sp. BM-2019]